MEPIARAIVRALRKTGIAIGSLVAAGLCVWLVGSVMFGQTGGAVATIVTVLLGGLIYVDIMRREKSSD